MDLMARLMTVIVCIKCGFLQYTRMTDEVTETLGSKGILAEALHGIFLQLNETK